MSTIIDVAVLIDAETIYNRTRTAGVVGSPDAPVFVQEQDSVIYMVSRSANEISGHGGAELDIHATPNQEIRWRASSLTFGDQYSVYLYDFFPKSDLLHDIRPETSEDVIPEINPADIMHPRVLEANLGYWQATALKEGRVTYHFKFMILRPTSATELEPVGYYQWDPFITISWQTAHTA